MNHQPFEDWLLADEPPAGDQVLERSSSKRSTAGTTASPGCFSPST
jgi:hypothetical protein